MKNKSLLYKFLFPTKAYKDSTSMVLLVCRIIFGIFLMTHGIQKLLNFHELTTTFADPLHIGSYLSVCLAIFAELFCSVAFIFGILYRLVMIPMMFTLFMATFVIHAGDPFSAKELSLVYLIIFLILYIIGPGKYSADRFIYSIIPSGKI